MLDAEATEGVEYFPVKWLANQRRAISNHFKIVAGFGDEYIVVRQDLADIYMSLYLLEGEMRTLRQLPPIGNPPSWVLEFVQIQWRHNN